MLTVTMMSELRRYYSARCHPGTAPLATKTSRPSRKLNTSDVQRGGRLMATHSALAINIVTPPAMPGVNIALGCRNSSTLVFSNYGFRIKSRTRVASCRESTSNLCSAVYAVTDLPPHVARGEPLVESV